jgi:hypothetical protein
MNSYLLENMQISPQSYRTTPHLDAFSASICALARCRLAAASAPIQIDA